jgi:hypothetical protein
MSASKTDDLDAVRAVVDAIKDLNPQEQQRIFRWAAEKLNLSSPFPAPDQRVSSAQVPSSEPQLPSHATAQAGPAGTDIKTFIIEKRPRNDVQFAAAVAYYYRFEAPLAERKDAINKDDLQESTRKAGRDRFADPHTTLGNAHKLGLLDKGPEKATFVINSVGENLVAMTLPDGTPAAKAGKKNNAKPVKKAAKKQKRRE